MVESGVWAVPVSVSALVVVGLLEELPPGDNNRILYLIERGMMRQAEGDYAGSVRDWQAAADKMEELDYYSLSKGAASWVANDQAKAYRGMPFEQILMHAYAAQSYFAMGKWEDAAVEGRNIVAKLENLNGFQTLPVNWTINSGFRKAFFSRVAEITRCLKKPE